MKILKNKKGSMLVESLVGFSIMTFVILLFIPMLTQMFGQLKLKQNETELWRFFQDIAIEETYTKQTRESNHLSFLSEWQNEHTLIVTEATELEVMTVELLQVHK